MTGMLFCHFTHNKHNYYLSPLKALLHEAISPATRNATDDDSIARQVVEYMLHPASYLIAMLQKLETKPTFSATHKGIFHCKTLQRGGVTCIKLSATYLATLLCCKLQKKLPRVTSP